MINKKLWVYDIETLASCFTYTAINIDTLEIVQFVIHKARNDLTKLIEHLLDCKGQIGFNNLNFDYPVIHDMLLHTKYQNCLTESWYDLSTNDIINRIYKQAQWIIDSQNSEPKVYTSIRDKDTKIPQLDLFKIWHFDNKARKHSCGLA